jgi:hypothetical protein
MNNSFKYGLTSRLDKMNIDMYMNVNIVFFQFSTMLCRKAAAVLRIRISLKLLKSLNFSCLKNPENIKLFLEVEGN